MTASSRERRVLQAVSLLCLISGVLALVSLVPVGVRMWLASDEPGPGTGEIAFFFLPLVAAGMSLLLALALRRETRNSALSRVYRIAAGFGGRLALLTLLVALLAPWAYSFVSSIPQEDLQFAWEGMKATLHLGSGDAEPPTGQTASKKTKEPLDENRIIAGPITATITKFDFEGSHCERYHPAAEVCY